MKYIAFGVRRLTDNRYAVCGQSPITYNWNVIEANFDCLPNANEAAKVLACKESKKYKCYIPCYGLGGYCIDEYYNGNKFDRERKQQ